jgi:serine/threonine-protein kinase RsbW
MTNSPRPAAVRFDRRIQADPGGVADAREELSRWLLEEFDLDTVLYNDMVLAVYEALANAAEFAYLTADTPGGVTLSAEHDSASSALTLTVADQGRWRHVDPSERCRSRGRGLPLIKGLASRADIDTSENGTTVRMVFDGVVPVVAHNGAEVANF